MSKRINIYVILALAVFMATCARPSAPVKSPPSTPADFGYEGREALFYYVEGLKNAHIWENNVKAARFFDRSLEQDSTAAAVLYAAADNLMMLDPALALEYSRKAADADTANVWYRSQLARLRVITGDYRGAVDTYRKLVDMSPHDPDNYRMLAALYDYTNLPFAAIAVLDTAEYRFGPIEEISAFKRELLIKAKLYDKAIAESLEMVDLYPYKYENYMFLGDLYAQTGKDSLALAYYNKSLELNPDAIDVIAAQNEYYKRKGDQQNYLRTAKQLFQSPILSLDAKLNFFRETIADRDYYVENYFQLTELASALLLMYPNQWEVVELYGSNMIAIGNIEEALRLYKGFASEAAPVKEAYESILEIEAYLDRPDSLAKYSEIALRAFPNDPELKMRKAYALMYMERNDQARKTLQEVLGETRSDSLKSVIYGAIGDMYHQEDNNKKTYENYDRALKLDPENVTVLNNYAYYLSLEKKKLDKALAMAEKVMELAPGNPTFLDTYGWVLYQLGRYDEARKVLQQAVSLDRTGSKELFVHYGDILYELGENFMAGVYWQKALEAGYDPQQIQKRLKTIGQ